jgi:uncharacterized protein
MSDPGTTVELQADARERVLVEWLRVQPGVVVGFSGGVDSAYLATIAVETLGADRVLAVIGRSASYPIAQWDTARDVATRVGIPCIEVDTRELDDPQYAANPANRCYFCKRELWSHLAPLARERGWVLADGTNADDLADHRPGAVAGREAEVCSPLVSAGLTKADIRTLSARRGLPTADQPSSPCLASRLPYGTSVTAERLAQVERAEHALRALGVRGDLRVRHHGELARVELAPHEIEAWLEPTAAEQLRAAVGGAGFARVAVDLRGFRSGSLNVLSGVVAG